MKDEVLSGYTRVSSILRYYNSFEGISPETLAHAAQRGELVHHYCYLYAHNCLIESPLDYCKGYVESFKKWFDLTVDKVVSAEERLYSDHLMVTGRYDMIVKLKGDDNITLIDLKTPASVSPTWGAQLAAYELLLQQHKGITIDRSMVIRLQKDGRGVQVIEYYKNQGHLSAFISMVQIYRYINQLPNLPLQKLVTDDIVESSKQAL